MEIRLVMHLIVEALRRGLPETMEEMRKAIWFVGDSFTMGMVRL